MSFLTILTIPLFLMSHTEPLLSPKTIESFQYHSPRIKLHHRLRITIRVHGSEELSDLLSDCSSLSEAIEDLGEEIDTMDDISSLASYNLRISIKTRDRRLKFYAGMDHLPLNGNAWYVGIRTRM